MTLREQTALKQTNKIANLGETSFSHLIKISSINHALIENRTQQSSYTTKLRILLRYHSLPQPAAMSNNKRHIQGRLEVFYLTK